MMDDLISRQTAADALILLQDHSDMPEDWHNGISAAVSCIYRVPSVLERKKGKWELADLPYCSACGETFGIETDYCPHCGAEMECE